MPPTIHVNIFTGPGVSKRESFSDSPVSFGREADNQIVITEKTASRKHGELRYEGDQWLLYNLSPNGTVVERKTVTKKPHVFKDKDVVRIGDHPVFEVSIGSLSKDGIQDSNVSESGSVTPVKADKTKKYMVYYMIYMAVIGLIVLSFFWSGGDHPAGSKSQTSELTETQITQEIISPLTNIKPEPREAAARLQFAGELYNTLDNSSSIALFKAYDAYRQALAYSGEKKFNGTDQLRFDDVQTRLSRAVATKYRDGFNQFKSGRYKEAQATFHDLIQLYYPVSSSEIFRNCERFRKECVDQMKLRNN